MMEVIQSELEIGHVSESIGLAFECFDFVVDSLDDAARDAVGAATPQASVTPP